VLKGAYIHFGAGSIDCTVRNLSETGAALDVTSPVGIPNELMLVTDDHQLSCRVIWRREKRIASPLKRKRAAAEP
jgi:hypothetical protein